MEIPEIEKNLGTLLEKATAEQGEKMLLHLDPAGISLSYRQFNELVNRCANVLVAESIQQGDHVAVMLPNCQEGPRLAFTWTETWRPVSSDAMMS